MSKCWIFLEPDHILQFEGVDVLVSQGHTLRTAGSNKMSLRSAALQAMERQSGVIACACRMVEPFETIHKTADGTTDKVFAAVGPVLRGSEVVVERVTDATQVMHALSNRFARTHLKELPEAAQRASNHWLSIKEQWVKHGAADNELEDAIHQSNTQSAVLETDARQASDILQTLTAVIRLSVAQLVVRSLSREPVDAVMGTAYEYVRLLAKYQAQTMAVDLVKTLPKNVAQDPLLASKSVGDKLAEFGIQWRNDGAKEVNGLFEKALGGL